MNKTRPEGQLAETRARTMRVIVQDVFGTPDVLRLEEVAVPEPASDQMLIRVRASSVNAAEWHGVTGAPPIARLSMGWRKPKQPTPGSDFAGTVEVLGADMTGFDVGDDVFGSVPAAYADYTVTKGTGVVAKPPEVSFEAAAALPIAGLTALQGLRDHGRLHSGESVLINGASGGVGTYAIQIAKAMGATVTAVCSTRNVEQALKLGADNVIDYTQSDFEGHQYDLFFDVVGLRSVADCKRVLKPGGRYVMISGPKHGILGPVRRMLWAGVSFGLSNKKFTWFVSRTTREDLTFLGELLATGQIESVIEGSYPLERAPEALVYLGEGHARAKNVIVT